MRKLDSVPTSASSAFSVLLQDFDKHTALVVNFLHYHNLFCSVISPCNPLVSCNKLDL